MTDFNASDFGARGDGRTNDTQALQAAIDAAAAAGGGTVHLTGGTYLISAAQGGAALLLKANVTLEGTRGYADPSVLKLANGSSTTDALVRSVGDHTGAAFLRLDGNRTHTTGDVSGWVIGDSTDVTLEQVLATQASGYGLDLRGSNSQVNVSGAITSNNGLDGIIASGLVNSQIADTYSRENDGNGLTVTGSVALLDTYSTSNKGHGVAVFGGVAGASATLISGDLSSNGLDGVHLQGTSNAVVQQLLFYTSTQGAAVQTVDARGTQVIDNTFQTGSLGSDLPAVALQDSTDTLVRGNIFQDLRFDQKTPLSPTVLETGTSDVTLIEDNYIGASLTAPLLVGADSLVLGNESTIYTIGTAGDDDINYNYGYAYNDRVIYGGDGNDELSAGVGQQVLVGGNGIDVLIGTLPSNRHTTTTFRYDTVDDSYRDATSSHADRIAYFNAATDKLDVAGLGFTGLGNGHNGTLAMVYNAAKNITYLKNYDANAQGHRFEVGLQGDYRGQLTAANFQTLITGTDSADTLKGTTHGQETLVGGAGRDTLSGLGSNDRLDGGADGDRLSGGSGADTFLFSALGDSTVTASGSTQGRDLITDFDLNAFDRIDVSRLGFTGLGDGTGNTLRLAYDSAHDLTRLYSQEKDNQGGHFEVAVRGDQVDGLQLTGIDFTLVSGPAVVTSLPPYRDTLTGTEGNDVLVGGNNRDVIEGGAGNDRLDGGANMDRLIGGAGTDRLTGGSGGDLFVFNRLEDSYRTATESHADLITDYSQSLDALYVRDLGFTSLGDGTGTTLNVSYNAAIDRTYVRNFTADDQGRSFQVTLTGDQVAGLTPNSFYFAPVHHEVALDLVGQASTEASLA
jgi:hypothetical protein